METNINYQNIEDWKIQNTQIESIVDRNFFETVEAILQKKFNY